MIMKFRLLNWATLLKIFEELKLTTIFNLLSQVKQQEDILKYRKMKLL